MELRTVLVTGGSGFIGSHFCREAASRETELYVLTRNPLNCGHLPDVVHCVSDLASIPENVSFDMVLNLAGEPLFTHRWNKKRKRLFRESRVGVTEQLYNFFEQRKNFPELLISGSAIGYYGSCGDQLLDEASRTRDGFSHELCAEWESAALAFERHGTRVCLLRTGLVMGKGGGMLNALQPLFRLGLGGRLGDGKQWMSWIHIDDLIGMVFHIVARSDLRHGVNGTAPNPVTNKVFTETLARVLGRPAFFHLPKWLLSCLLGEMGREMISSQRVIPRKSLETGYRFAYPQLESALIEAAGH